MMLERDGAAFSGAKILLASYELKALIDNHPGLDEHCDLMELKNALLEKCYIIDSLARSNEGSR